MRKLIIITVLSLFAFSCSTLPSTASFADVERIMTTNLWLLQDENGTVISYNGQEVSLGFNKGESTQAHGFAGCNQYFTNVNILPESIKFGEIASTLMSCPEMDSEQAFLDLLTMVDTYEITGKELKLYQGKILLLRFIKN